MPGSTDAHATRDEPVLVGGAGLSGLATALGAALHRRRVTVFKAAELLGDAAAISGGQVWAGATHVEAREGIDDDLERTERYVRDIARDIRRPSTRRPCGAGSPRRRPRSGTGRTSAPSAGR